MRADILAGDLGTRLSEETETRAKPMVEIGEHQSLSAKKARARLGWRPLFSLDDGLRKTVSWYSSFLATRAAE